MKAAVITAFADPPRYQEFAEPVPEGRQEMLIEVLAAGLHHLTLAKAAGTHYSSTAALPLVPGVDGVGRGSDGKLRYFVVDGARSGSLAEKTVIETDHSLVLPRDCDPVTIAAAMNPAMASWLALRCRVPFKKRQNVLILGATGNAGTMAVQIARHLGAGQIVAVGRDERRLTKLPALGATEIATQGDPRLGRLASQADVVLDFVWGESTAHAMDLVMKQRADRSRALVWIQIGSIGGENAPISATYLRAANFQIVGSGLGSISGRDMLKELPALVKELARGTLQLDVKPMQLRDVERAWAEVPRTSERIVLTP